VTANKMHEKFYNLIILHTSTYKNNHILTEYYI